MKEVSTSDAGTYEITIRNKLGEVSSSVEVKIKKIYQAPVFIQQLTDVQQVIKRSRMVLFICCVHMCWLQWIVKQVYPCSLKSRQCSVT